MNQIASCDLLPERATWITPRNSLFGVLSYLKEICRVYSNLYNNQVNARALIGQSAVCSCAGKPTEKSRVFLIVI